MKIPKFDLLNNKENERNQKQQFETIDEYEEHKSTLKQGEQNPNSQLNGEENNPTTVQDKDDILSDSIYNAKLRMINNKKQSHEIRQEDLFIFKDIKSNSGTNYLTMNQSLSKIRRQKQKSQRLSRSLDSLLEKSINYVNLLKNEANQQINGNQNKNDIPRLDNQISKKMRSNSVTDEVFGKKESQSIIDQLDDLSQLRWIQIKESQLLSYLTTKIKINSVKTKRPCQQTKYIHLLEIMNEYYSRQYFHYIKSLNMMQNEINLNNIQQFQILPQFFNEDAAAKYILKLYKNRNILKKNYVEEIYRSKDIQIQFKDCCLEGKCMSNGSKIPHVNKIKCMNKYLLLYRSFQDEAFFNDLVINTYDFLISNYELFTQMVCFFFFNENVSFNRQFKCLEFCLRWIKRRPFTFLENQDLFFKMKEFVTFLKLKYSSIYSNSAEQKSQPINCKCSSFLSKMTNIKIINNTQIQTQIPQTLTSQTNLSSNESSSQASNSFHSLKNNTFNKDGFNNFTFNNNTISHNVSNNNSYTSGTFNNSLNNNNIQNNSESFHSNQINSGNVSSLSQRSQKRSGPPPALVRYNNKPNTSPLKKLSFQVTQSLNSQQQSLSFKNQEMSFHKQIIDDLSVQNQCLKEQRTGTSMSGSQIATDCSFPNRLETQQQSCQDQVNIETFKLFPQRKERFESLLIPSFNRETTQNVKSMINTTTGEFDDISFTPQNKSTNLNHLTQSFLDQQQEQANTNNDNLPQQMSKSLQLAHTQSCSNQVENDNQLVNEKQKQSNIRFEKQRICLQNEQFSQSTDYRDKSYSVAIQNLDTQNFNQKVQSKLLNNQNKSLTINVYQLNEFSQKINQLENELNTKISKQYKQKINISYPLNFSCLSQEQINKIQDNYEYQVQSEYIQSFNIQIQQEKYSKDIFSQIDIDLIAQQICLIDHSLFNNISIYEFFSDKRLKQFNLFSNHSSRKNLSILKKRFNEFAQFLILMILLQQTEEQTLILYEQLLELSEKALNYQNFNLSLQIYTSFNSGLVYEKIKSVQQNQSLIAKQRFNHLEKTIEIGRSFNALKEAMHQANPPLVPSLNILTRDFTQLDQMRDEYIQIQHKQQLNLIKFEEISKLTSIIFNVKSHNYPFIIQPTIYEFFCSSYQKFMAQYIDMKDSQTIDVKLSEFARKQTQNKL